MKKFLIKGIFVFLTFALVLCVMTRMAYKSEFKRLKRNLTFPKNILAAAVGDSRVEVYFDPDEIPWMRNLGMSAMPFTVSAKLSTLRLRFVRSWSIPWPPSSEAPASCRAST